MAATLQPVPRSMFSYSILVSFLLLWASIVPPSSAAENVTVSLYYESLCPYCADFIVNHLVKAFQTGLINIINLRLIPWGNAWIQTDGSTACQHGADECMLNTMEACTITIYPDVARHYRFIYCVERLTLEHRHNEWANCFDMSGLGTVPIDCYRNGYGNAIEKNYATETSQLNPPHRFVPWVVVNNKPLQEDFKNFLSYVCKAYTGNPRPEACGSFLESTMDMNDEMKSAHPPVRYAHRI